VQNSRSIKSTPLKVFRFVANVFIVASKPITLALQCSDPPIRLTGTFPPTATLTEVLLHFEQESNGQLVVFGRRGEEAVLSVLGREFGITEGPGGGGATTLAGMGVGGNVLMRLGFRKLGSSTSSSWSTLSSESRAPLPQSTLQPISSAPAPSISQSTPKPSPSPQLDELNAALSPPSISETFPLPSEVPAEPRTSPSLPASPEVSPTPPLQVFGPQNRNRVVYSAASASTPAAAKRTPR
jgi:hypothetical protein